MVRVRVRVRDGGLHALICIRVRVRDGGLHALICIRIREGGLHALICIRLGLGRVVCMPSFVLGLGLGLVGGWFACPHLYFRKSNMFYTGTYKRGPDTNFFLKKHLFIYLLFNIIYFPILY